MELCIQTQKCLGLKEKIIFNPLKLNSNENAFKNVDHNFRFDMSKRCVTSIVKMMNGEISDKLSRYCSRLIHAKEILVNMCIQIHTVLLQVTEFKHKNKNKLNL